jgi:hypothetical protein
MRYLDSCVAVDHCIGDAAPGFTIDEPLCFSILLSVEARRAFRRLQYAGALDLDRFAGAIRALEGIERAALILPMTNEILELASGHFVAPIRTLDAIHLATAMMLRERRYPDLLFATHDRRLAMAARLAEFEVVGVN